MHRRLLLAAMLLAMSATVVHASTATSKLNALARYALEKLRSHATLAELRESPVAVTESGELDVFITGTASRAALEAAGARVRTEIPGGIFTATLPLDAVERVAALAEVRTIEGAARAMPELNVSVPTTNAPFSRGPGPYFIGVNGEGVIVGDVDTGIDYGNGDFDDPLGNTRILNIWDQTVSGSGPSGFGYGREWDSADIDANLSTELDLDGHGTHVSGIMAGDGSLTGGGVPAHTYAGMAPMASIIMVKTNFSATGIVDGVDYIFQRATDLGMPAVVNLSLGLQYGPHDGSSPFEAGLSALTGPGRILVKSAGNSGGDPMHAECIVGAGQTEATLDVSGSAYNRVFAIDGYYDADDNLTMSITTPNGTTLGPIARGGSVTSPTTNGYVDAENGVYVTSRGDYEVHISVQNIGVGTLNGTWTITFAPVSLGASNGEIDMWRYASSGGLIADFDIGGQPDEEVISEPGNADSAIAVGAWTTKKYWQDCYGNVLSFVGSTSPGTIAGFSSSGPTRDGRMKPEICAPGTAIGSSRTFDVAMSCSPSGSLLLRDNQNHMINQGTSMSSPHAAGAAALVLQKHPDWTPSHIIQYFEDHATTDGYTGAVWNKRWGYGKLRLGDLLNPSVEVLDPDGGEVIVIGQPQNLTWNASDNDAVTAVDIRLSRDDGATFEDIALGVPNTGSYPWNVTGPPTVEGRIEVRAQDPSGNESTDLSDASFEISTGVSAPPAGAVTEFALSIASRNPTRGSVDVEFRVPHAADVSVAIYDLQGRMVTALAEGHHAPGRYHARWNGGAAGPGMYFARMRAESLEKVQRIIVLH